MRSKKKVAVVLSLLLVTTIFYVCTTAFLKRQAVKGYTDQDAFKGVIVPMEENSTLSFDVKSYEKDGKLYLFFPCRASLEHVVYYSVDEEGNYLERFETDFTREDGRVLDYTVTAMQSEIPSMNISVEPGFGTMEEVDSSELHTSCAYGTMTLEVTDERAAREGWQTLYVSQENNKDMPSQLQIRGRGNITWSYEKKPYQIKLEKKTDLLSMGKAKKWVLLANYGDRSLLRNQVFLGMSQDMGLEFSPKIEPVDLFIDGEYMGSYSLCTKPEVSESRVNIDSNRDFLVRFGMAFRNYSFDLDTWSMPEDFRMANIEDIHDEAMLERAAPLVQEIVTAIEDTETDEYTKYLDLTSWAKYYLLQEFSKNTDAVIRSVYAYWIEEDQKLYMGPAWDFDQSAGSLEQPDKEYDYLSPYGFCARYEGWYVPLFEHEEFVNEVERVYREEGVREAFVRSYQNLPAYAEEIRASAEMNFVRWDILGLPEKNDIQADSFEGQIEYLEQWLKDRAGYMEHNIKN